MIKLLHKHRIEKVLVVNDEFQLRGLITVKDIQKAMRIPKPVGTNRAAGAGGCGGGYRRGTEERGRRAGAGRCGWWLGYSPRPLSGVLDRVAWVKREKNYPDLQVIGGNIAIAAAASAGRCRRGRGQGYRTGFDLHHPHRRRHRRSQVTAVFNVAEA